MTMNSIICGDALEALQSYESNVFDAIICDPPAGIGFMLTKDRTWDSNKGGRNQWIAWLASIMREALRTLKPGGHCLVWALPRTSHWTATALEDAGFEIRDVVHHMYSADTALRDFLASLSSEQREAFERLVESQGSSVLYHLFGSGFPKSLDVSKKIDAYFGVEREIVGIRKDIKGGPGTAIGSLQKAMREHGARKYAEGLSHDNNVAQHGGVPITAPATEAAKAWSGFGSNLKPAAEHWILCRKPLSERSIAENVLRWGTGTLNIDASRIGTAADMNPRDFDDTRRTSPKFSNVYSNEKPQDLLARTGEVPNGRFPANLVLSHSLMCTEEQCDDGCPVLTLDRQSGTRKPGYRHNPSTNRTTWFGAKDGSHICGERGYDDQGTASRYFAQFRPDDDTPPFYYAAKASRRERNEGCEALPAKQGFEKNTSAMIVRVDPDTGETTYSEYKPSSHRNHHPTVKPLSLIKYLVTLITPPNGIILDMFAGSGTTGVAAVQCRFGYVLIEQAQEYVEIARARVSHAEQEMAEKAERVAV